MVGFFDILKSKQNMQDQLSRLSVTTWVNYLIGEKSIPQKFAGIIPKMPPEKVQLHFTEASGRDTLAQALDFVNLANETLTQHGLRALQQKKLLDFGCGWAL